MPTKILKYYSGDLLNFYENIETETKNFKIPEKNLKILKKKDLDDAKKILLLCEKLKIKIITYYDENFPERLREIKSCPILLYYYGNLKVTFNPCAAVIGTRNCSSLGLKNSEKITKELVQNGITTISGCAKGIDASVHKNTIQSNGNTVAVLGTSLDSKYPYENVKLKEEIIEKNGLILSEYPPKTKTYAWHFPVRNRIISAMSDCVIVVQSKEKSGTILTAKKAIEYGKKLFCMPPSDIFDENSKGVKKCLEEGGKILIGIEDILNIYKTLKYKPTKQKDIKDFTEKKPDKKRIPEKFMGLINLIGEEKRLDEILRQTKNKPKDTLIMLTQLELLNILERTTTGYRKVV